MIPPELTVPSGAVVELHTKEASDGQITESATVDDLAGWGPQAEQLVIVSLS